MSPDADSVRRYRQALWDIYGILGYDQDGDPTPDALVWPDLVTLVVEAAKEFVRQYDELLEELPLPPSGSSEAHGGLQ